MTDPEDVDRLEELFARALDLPPGQRRAFVERSCGDDAALRDRLLTMLARSEGAFPEARAVPPDELFGPSQDGPSPGRQLGDFELLSELGEGGMGVVYRARQLSLDRLVALKVLRPSQLLAPERSARFEREVDALRGLDHPGIVSVLEAGEDQGTRYFAMDLVDGNDLADELLRLREEATRLGVDSTQLTIRGTDSYVRTVVRIVRDAAAALQYAHDRGLVHRDIKPSNLLLDAGGAVRLVDFGLARDLSAETVTAESVLAGSAAYMSPEQADGQLHEKVDRRSDIYSLGVVLYELLTLQRPHEGRTERELLEAIQREQPRTLRDRNPRLPRDLEAVVATAMAKEPSDRYASAAEFEADLNRVLRSEAVRARLPTLGVRALRWTRRHRRWAAGAVLAGLAVWVAFAVGQAAERQADAERLASALGEVSDDLEVSTLTVHQRREVHGVCAGILETPGLHDGDVLERARALSADLVAYAESRKQAMRGVLAEVDGPGGDAFYETALRVAVLQEALELSGLFPEDEELATLADPESLRPVLAITVSDAAGRPLAASVEARRIDFLSTQPSGDQVVDLGRAPLETTIVPGLYRLVVRFPDGAVQEFSRSLLEAGARTTVDVRRQPWPDDRTSDMVRFEAATYTIPVEPGVMSHLAGETVTVEPFWLDRHEVSNADYLEFLAAQPGAPLPKYWQDERPVGWERLPVTGLSWEEMRTYAEWRGKRLPTLAEWTWAARGAEMRPHAWSPDRAEPPGCTVVNEDQRPRSFEEAWAQYLLHARPVDGCPEGATPEGLQHMYGNADEFTESVWVQRWDDGSWVPFLDQRILAGKSWKVMYPEEDLRFQGYTRTDRFSAQEDLGFRLALSAEP